MPNILDPYIGASSEKQPVYGNEEEANHIAGQSDADEKYWKSLKRKKELQIIHKEITSSYQSLILKAVVNGSHEQPKGPEVLEPEGDKNKDKERLCGLQHSIPELQKIISSQNQDP